MTKDDAIQIATDILSKHLPAPYILVVPNGDGIDAIAQCDHYAVKSVRVSVKGNDELAGSYNDELPEGVTILSGICHSFEPNFRYIEIILGNGSEFPIYLEGSAREHFEKKFEFGDKLRLCLHLEHSRLTLRSADDILSHTRTKFSTINLKE